MELFRFTPGSTPLLVSMPHPGTYLPDGVAERLTDEARLVPDTDWHLERLYDFAAALGAGVLAATHSRYLVDLNRPPDNRPLYPGGANTGLCPTELFDGGPLYLPGQEPDAAEVGAVDVALAIRGGSGYFHSVDPFGRGLMLRTNQPPACSCRSGGFAFWGWRSWRRNRVGRLALVTGARPQPRF